MRKGRSLQWRAGYDQTTRWEDTAGRRGGAAVTPSPPQQFGRRLGGVPPGLLGVVRPPGLHFSFGVKKSTGRLGSGGGPLLLSPHPTQANTPPPPPPPLRGPNLPPNVCPASSREMETSPERGSSVSAVAMGREKEGRRWGGAKLGRSSLGPWTDSPLQAPLPVRRRAVL